MLGRVNKCLKQMTFWSLVVVLCACGGEDRKEEVASNQPAAPKKESPRKNKPVPSSKSLKLHNDKQTQTKAPTRNVRPKEPEPIVLPKPRRNKVKRATKKVTQPTRAKKRTKKKAKTKKHKPPARKRFPLDQVEKLLSETAASLDGSLKVAGGDFAVRFKNFEKKYQVTSIIGRLGLSSRASGPLAVWIEAKNLKLKHQKKSAWQKIQSGAKVKFYGETSRGKSAKADVFAVCISRFDCAEIALKVSYGETPQKETLLALGSTTLRGGGHFRAIGLVPGGTLRRRWNGINRSSLRAFKKIYNHFKHRSRHFACREAKEDEEGIDVGRKKIVFVPDAPIEEQDFHIAENTDGITKILLNPEIGSENVACVIDQKGRLLNVSSVCKTDREMKGKSPVAVFRESQGDGKNIHIFLFHLGKNGSEIHLNSVSDGEPLFLKQTNSARCHLTATSEKFSFNVFREGILAEGNPKEHYAYSKQADISIWRADVASHSEGDRVFCKLRPYEIDFFRKEFSICRNSDTRKATVSLNTSTDGSSASVNGKNYQCEKGSVSIVNSNVYCCEGTTAVRSGKVLCNDKLVSAQKPIGQ